MQDARVPSRPKVPTPGQPDRFRLRNRPMYRTTASLGQTRATAAACEESCRDDARTIVAQAGEVVIVAGRDREGLTAVRRPDTGDRPSIKSELDEAVVAVEIVRLPDEGHRHHVATVLVRTLAVLELRVVGVDKGSVQAARAVERVALQRLAPAVVAARTDVMGDALFQRDLKSVVVGVLVGANDEDVAVDRVRRRRAELGVQRPAIVHCGTGVGVAAGLGQIGAACTTGTVAVMLNCGPLMSLYSGVLRFSEPT